jgi:hypothetical protein
MFSANENLILRQSKKRVVAWVEECIPEAALDAGVNVMVMQVSCKAPGCVPLETAIIIVFPSSESELLPGLKESAGGSYKTKILLPLNEVTKADVLEALPPAFPGGLRTMEKLCVSARDLMLAKITQIFGDENDESSVENRKLMTLYLQSSLEEYMNLGCVAPEWGKPFPTVAAPVDSGSADAGPEDVTDERSESRSKQRESSNSVSAPPLDSSVEQTVRQIPFPPTVPGTFPKLSIDDLAQPRRNIMIRRPTDDDEDTVSVATARLSNSGQNESNSQSVSASISNRLSEQPSSSPDVSRRVPSVNSRAALRQQQAASLELNRAAATASSSHLLSRLVEREHAPGIRQAGCPCCEPDHPSNVVDKMMLL